MKITFLGTSHGVPSATRSCSSIMLESNGAVYIIDAGAPVLDAMLKHGQTVENFRAMFITHSHSDHTFGLLHLADIMNWYYKQCEADFYVTSEDLIKATKDLIKAADGLPVDEERIRFHLPKEGVMYQDENIKVEYIRTKHTDYSFAILVTEGDKRVLFSGDFSQELKGCDVPEIIEENLDAFVTEMAHFDMGMYKPYLDKCNAEKVIFTHVYQQKNFNEIEAEKSNFKFESIIANDGDTFNF